MKLFENVWFIGISTGIISGILVFFITKWFMDKKGNTEHLKQLKLANQEVISCLKPYIADKGLPEIKIFKALIASIARKYSVNTNEMYSVEIYCEELIHEIISDVYVSNEKKEEYAHAISIYTETTYKEIMNKNNISDKNLTNYIDYKIYREKINKKSSMLISLMAAIFTMFFSVAAMVMTEYALPQIDAQKLGKDQLLIITIVPFIALFTIFTDLLVPKVIKDIKKVIKHLRKLKKK